MTNSVPFSGSAKQGPVSSEIPPASSPGCFPLPPHREREKERERARGRWKKPGRFLSWSTKSVEVCYMTWVFFMCQTQWQWTNYIVLLHLHDLHYHIKSLALIWKRLDLNRFVVCTKRRSLWYGLCCGFNTSLVYWLFVNYIIWKHFIICARSNLKTTENKTITMKLSSSINKLWF